MTTICSRTPSCVWVSPSRINGRVDAAYFHCDYLPLDDCLATFPKREAKTLDDVIVKPRRVLYQQTTSYARDEAPDGAVPFISGVDLDGSTMGINWSSVRYVGRWMLEKYPNGQLRDGSLLIKVKGPNQHTAFVTKADRTALVSGTVFFAGVRGSNPHYLAAYLSSGPGTAWRSRLRTNTTVEFIGNEELRAVPVLVPDSRIQDYIGAKVELAERCRGEATKRWSRALKCLADAMGTPLDTATFEVKSAVDVSADGYDVASIRPVVATVSAHRIDRYVGAQFFHPRRAKALLVIERSGLKARRLEDLATRFTERITSEEMRRLALVYVGLAQIDSTTGFIAKNGNEEPTGTCSRFKAGDILFSKLRPYLNKVSICPPHLAAAAGSTELLTYRAKDGVDPFFLFFVLKSPLVLNQVIDITSGSTHPRVDPELVDDARIPIVPSKTIADIAAAARSTVLLLHRATELVDEAKADVAALIEGKLDTAAIIAGRLKPPSGEEALIA